jgi:hypothetical protein
MIPKHTPPQPHHQDRLPLRTIPLLGWDLRFSSALARYTAAVCAAGPLPIMTTLLCIPLAVLLARRLPFPVTGLLLCFCKPAAAAIETPAVEDRNEKKPRRKVEENSLTAFVDVCVVSLG